MFYSKKNQFIVILLLFILLIASYIPGMHGALYYDDYSNLNPLTEISSFHDALHFISNGIAGELGRPISLATFIPFHQDWPNNSSSIILFNILLHSINFLLIGTLGYLISINITQDKSLSFRIAWCAAFLWAIMPLIASTTLIAIQRMTSLTSFFMLLGLCIYVKLLSSKNETKIKDLIIQLSVIFIFTLLAVFSKENGALLPAYALLIELLIKQNKTYKPLIKTRKILLLLPTIFIIYYLSPFSINWLEYSEHRGFSPLDRLRTQTLILLEYLKVGFLPQSPTMFSPFHDYYPISEWSLKTIFTSSIIAISILIALACLQKNKWISFAILWFLNSHLIESTTILLELYFEHRNYLAFYGFILSISYLIFTHKTKYKNFLILGFISYTTLTYFILFSVTSLWGDKQKAADVWHNKHPGSSRAVLHAVFTELGSNNSETAGLNNDFIELQRKVRAINILDKTSEMCTNCLDTRILALLYSCEVNEDKININRLNEIANLGETGNVNITFTTHLFDLFELIKRNKCNGVSFTDLDHTITELLRNERAISNRDDLRLLFVKAMIYEANEMYNEAMQVLTTAEEKSIQSIPILQYQLHIYVIQGKIDEAIRAIDRRTKSADISNTEFLQKIEEIRISFIESNGGS